MLVFMLMLMLMFMCDLGVKEEAVQPCTHDADVDIDVDIDMNIDADTDSERLFVVADAALMLKLMLHRNSIKMTSS